MFTYCFTLIYYVNLIMPVLKLYTIIIILYAQRYVLLIIHAFSAGLWL